MARRVRAFEVVEDVAGQYNELSLRHASAGFDVKVVQVLGSVLGVVGDFMDGYRLVLHYALFDDAMICQAVTRGAE